MRPGPTQLINTAAIEIWPAWLLQARSNGHARALANGDWALRRKREGAFLAVLQGGDVRPLIPNLDREPGIDGALAAGAALASGKLQANGWLAHPSGRSTLLALGISERYGVERGLLPVAEPRRLTFAGRDRYRRPLWLLPPAARAWRQLGLAACGDGVTLEAISGFRSSAYQRAIFERKLARGLAIDSILRVNAAPGFSEHHSGRAIDIGTPGEPPAEESFEQTPAFRWLLAHAGRFGFRLSFPRDNPHRLAYEPWHWCWQVPATGMPA
jgi:D-alanyl-D-alanine carboxypeptidase